MLLKEGGARGMWRGTGPTVVRLSLGAGINFVVLEKLKAFMLHVRGRAVCGCLLQLRGWGVCSTSGAINFVVLENNVVVLDSFVVLAQGLHAAREGDA